MHSVERWDEPDVPEYGMVHLVEMKRQVLKEDRDCDPWGLEVHQMVRGLEGMSHELEDRVKSRVQRTTASVLNSHLNRRDSNHHRRHHRRNHRRRRHHPNRFGHYEYVR